MEIKSQHTHIDIVTRSKGHSVLAKAAYNARDKLKDEFTGKVHNYSKKDDLVFSKIFLPKHIPKEYENREYLWNEVEKIEKSKNSQLARNLIFEIPRELNPEDRIKLVTEFVEDNFVSKGMIADVNIHNSVASDGGEQPHAHILLTLREIDEKGKWKAKSKKVYVFDENGEKIKLPSGNYKSYKEDINDWNKRENAKIWREDFSKKANEYLEKNKIDKRIDPRTFKEQGREELPQIHLGTASYQMEKKGIQTERGNINRRIIKINQSLKGYANELVDIGRWIGKTIKELTNIFREFSKEKEQESKFEPELFNLYSYLEIYHKMQNEIALSLTGDDRKRKSHYDTKKYIHTLAYMRNNKIKTIIDYQLKKDELNKMIKDNKSEIKECSQGMQTLETLFKQADIIKANIQIYKKYENLDNSFFNKLTKKSKEDFYKEHKTEIDAYKRARGILKKLSGTEKIDRKTWENKKEEYSRKISGLEFKQKEIKEEIKQLNHIKYLVDKVNEEFDIDIDILLEQEYHKAIARGETPTPMAKVRYYQRQNELADQKKEKTKEYYKNKGKMKDEMDR